MTVLSFVINNYNYDRFVGAAIESALQQDCNPDLDLQIEVIVVDDGSTDRSREVIQTWVDQSGGSVIPVFKSNGGQASAFNAGFAASSGDWICFLDADDVVRSDKAAHIIRLGDRFPEISWIFHPLLPVDAELKPLETARETATVRSSLVMDWTEIDVTAQMQQGRLDSSQLPFPIPATSGLCFRRSHLAQILPMPESEGISLNDTYLQFAALGNATGLFLNQPIASQRYHNNNGFVTQANPVLNRRIFLLTAYWLQSHFPALQKFSQALLARSVTECWRSKQEFLPEERAIFEKYLLQFNQRDRLRLYAKALYRYLNP